MAHFVVHYRWFVVMCRPVSAALVTLLPSGLALVIAQRVPGAEGRAGLQIASITGAAGA